MLSSNQGALRTSRSGRAVGEVVEEHHEHMVDLETGKVLEFQDAELMDKLNEIAEKSGYHLVDHDLVLHVKKK